MAETIGTVMEILGDFSDGRSSKALPARLTLDDQGNLFIYQVDQPSLLVQATLSEVKVSSRLGNTPRSIGFSDSSEFVTDENDVIDAYLKQHGRFAGVLHYMETHIAFIVIATVTTVGLTALFVVHGIPLTAKVIAEQIPSSVVRSMGKGSVEILDRTLFDSTRLDQNERARVQALAEPILSKQDEQNVRLIFRSGMGPNALALPDGTIIFTDGLIELVENDEELLAILFHELGHIEHRHLLRRMIQDSVITVLFLLIVGDVETIDIVFGLPTLLIDLAYSREFELEADLYALSSMKTANIALEHFANVMTRLQDQHDEKLKDKGDIQASDTSRIFRYFSTHPATADRVALVKQFNRIGHITSNNDR